MAYQKQTWANGQGPPFVGASALQHIEDGLEAAAAVADNALAAAGTGATPTGAVIAVYKPAGGSWPARPSASSSVTYLWVGDDPSPPIVTSGTGGMRSGIDLRAVTVS